MAYEVPIDTKALDGFLTKIDSSIVKIEGLDSKVKDLNRSLKETRDSSVTIGGRPMSSVGSGGGPSSPTYTREFRGSGPFSRYEYEQRRLDQLKSSGYGGSALRDREARTASARRTADRRKK